MIFLLVSAAIFTDMMVYSLVIPVLPSYATSLGAGPLTIGIIFGAFSVSLLVFSIPLGLLSDRTGRRPLMVAGMLTLAAATIVFALSANVYVLILARLIQGISGAATWSAGLALLADTYGPEERGGKLGLAMSVMSVGMLLGPVAGGLIYDNLGYTATFVIPAIIASVIGMLFMTGKTPHPHIVKSDGTSYLKPIRKAPAVFFTCAAIIVIGAATFGVAEPYLPVYLYEYLRGDADGHRSRLRLHGAVERCDPAVSRQALRPPRGQDADRDGVIRVCHRHRRCDAYADAGVDSHRVRADRLYDQLRALAHDAAAVRPLRQWRGRGFAGLCLRRLQHTVLPGAGARPARRGPGNH